MRQQGLDPTSGNALTPPFDGLQKLEGCRPVQNHWKVHGFSWVFFFHPLICVLTIIPTTAYNALIRHY